MPQNPTPPWRSLDGPGSTSATSPAPTDPQAGPAPAAHGRLIATVVVALTCVALAFALAATATSSAEVVVEGGTVLAPATMSSAEALTVPAAAGEIVVEIVGAVREPGVFRLAAGSRVADLVERAGGFGPRVDTERTTRDVNLAATLRDGDRVRVPSRDDPLETTPEAASEPSGSGPLDLNTATAEQLDTLPGVGPVTVEKILAARDEAPFTSVDDLRTRGLVGEKTFERIRDAITVR